MTKKANLTSDNIKEDRIGLIKHLFPEVVAENKIEWDKLRKILGEDLDNQIEKFNFTWAGKSRAIKAVLEPSKGTLKPAKDEGIKFDESENIFIEGDNLEVLKLLQKAYFEKVKMIYIDPPYNTGGDFVYKDDFKSPIENYLKQTGQKNGDGEKLATNPETNGRFHSDWLTMMYPRLKLAWNLLREDGVIFISIDDHEVHHLRQVMDEVFGEENFVSNIVVQTNPRGRTLDKYLAKTFEYILVYIKNQDMDGIYQEAKNEKAMGEYKKHDEKATYRELELRNRNPVFNRTNRPNLYFPIYVNPQTGNVSLTQDPQFSETALPLNSTGVEGCWTWGKTKIEANIDLLVAKKVSTGVWRIYRKDYVPDGGATTKGKTLWIEKEFNNENGKEMMRRIFGAAPFDFPKSVDLIKRCANLASKESDIILDFFAGSGTTAHAVLELNKEDGGNRKYILVQLPEKTAENSEARKAGYKTIAEITKERIRRVIKGYGENPQPIDSGFKVFKLDKSNYPENNFEYDPEKSDEENQTAFKKYLEKAGQLPLLEAGNSLDIVYENIVKEGLSLNSKVTNVQIGSNSMYLVSDGDQTLYISLESKVNPDTMKVLTSPEFKNKIFICLDSAVDDSAKANLSLNLELKTI